MQPAKRVDSPIHSREWKRVSPRGPRRVDRPSVRMQHLQHRHTAIVSGYLHGKSNVIGHASEGGRMESEQGRRQLSTWNDVHVISQETLLGRGDVTDGHEPQELPLAVHLQRSPRPRWLPPPLMPSPCCSIWRPSRRETSSRSRVARLGMGLIYCRFRCSGRERDRVVRDRC